MVHKDFMPNITNTLLPTLNHLGYGLAHIGAYGFYKLFPLNGSVINNTHDEEFKLYRFPFMDIFVMEWENEKSKISGDIWGTCFYLKLTDYAPLQRYAFGPTTVWGPYRPEDPLDRCYDYSWRDVWYQQKDHKSEETIEAKEFDMLPSQRGYSTGTGEPLLDRITPSLLTQVEERAEAARQKLLEEAAAGY